MKNVWGKVKYVLFGVAALLIAMLMRRKPTTTVREEDAVDAARREEEIKEVLEQVEVQRKDINEKAEQLQDSLKPSPKPPHTDLHKAVDEWNNG